MRLRLLLLVSSLTVYAFSQPPVSPHFRIQKLAEGVFAAIASDTGYAVCNAGIVDVGDGTLIFDTFISPRAAADLRKVALALTGKPILYVVNSHFHNDHIRGNQVFAGVRIISTVTTRKFIAENEPGEIRWENANAPAKLAEARKALAAEHDRGRKAEDRVWVKYYEAILDNHDSLRTVLPDVTFEGRLVLHGSGREVDLIEMGPGHTQSDLILFLPAEKIAFMGDLLFVDCHPYMPDGSPEGWLHALERTVGFHPQTLVPGHGPVTETAYLDTMMTYIRSVEHLGEELAKRGAAEKEIAAQAIPAAFQSWRFPRFFLPNLKFITSLAKPITSGK